MSGRLITGGEAMMTITAAGVGAVRSGQHARLGMAGSEATVAIGVHRLGHNAVWISRVGDDAPGSLIEESVRGSGVHAIVTHTSQPTGAMLKEHRTAAVRRVHYYRSGSAASRLSAGDAVQIDIRADDVVHLTGITAALSESSLRFVECLRDAAREAGATVSLDVNYRAGLWDESRAMPVLRRLVQSADIVFASDNEAQMVTGIDADASALVDALRQLGPRVAVVTSGAEGAWYSDRTIGRQPAITVDEVDPFGAGDAFVAGFLAAHLDGLATAECCMRGAQVAAIGVSTEGDWEGLPTLQELETIFSTSSIAR